ncbi:MAG: hypothetical protein J0M08_07605 [Bacteroidetes bacterium]|nr:hypothetical protein [Bacteroidota bacterium]
MTYIILITVTNSLFATTFLDADSLFSIRLYSDAVVAYERLAYQSETSIDFDKSLLKKANCYKQLGCYPEAEATLSRLVFTEISDTLAAECRFQLALCSYLNSNFNLAETQLLQLKLDVTNPALTLNSELLHILILNEKFKWSDCKLHIQSIVKNYQLSSAMKDSLLSLLNNEYADKKLPKLKIPGRAENISVFLPGMGHVYSGYTKEGIWSSVFNLSGFAFTGLLVYNKYYFSSFTIGTGLLQMFYVGGIRRSKFLAEKRNDVIKKEFNSRVKIKLTPLLM